MQEESQATEAGFHICDFLTSFSAEGKEMGDGISPITYTHNHCRSHTLERIQPLKVRMG